MWWRTLQRRLVVARKEVSSLWSHCILSLLSDRYTKVYVKLAAAAAAAATLLWPARWWGVRPAARSESCACCSQFCIFKTSFGSIFPHRISRVVKLSSFVSSSFLILYRISFMFSFDALFTKETATVVMSSIIYTRHTVIIDGKVKKSSQNVSCRQTERTVHSIRNQKNMESLMIW